MSTITNIDCNVDWNELDILEKFLETSMVVKMAPFSFLLALNFFKQSTVSCLNNAMG